MGNGSKLFLIRSLHTVIWFVMAVAIFYILYAGLFDRIGLMVWVCMGLVLVEGVILCAFKWQCPLTLLCRRYTDNYNVGFDIFLPRWLAQYNKLIFTALFLLGTILVTWRTMSYCSSP